MRGDTKDPAHFRRAFAQAAEDLDLKLERPQRASPWGALVIAVHSDADIDNPPPLSDQEGQAIKDAIHQIHLLDFNDPDPEELFKLATRPFYCVRPENTYLVDDQFLPGWLKSASFTQLKAVFPAKVNADQIQISQETVLFLGPVLASITYTIQETTDEHGTVVSTAAALMKKEYGTWRLHVVACHGVAET